MGTAKSAACLDVSNEIAKFAFMAEPCDGVAHRVFKKLEPGWREAAPDGS